MPSRRVQEIGFSPTLAVNDLARKLRAQGEDVVDFSAGQPDFPTPDAVKEAGAKAIADNQTRYTANAGLPELREAIAASLQRDLGLDYPPERIVVSPGAKASLYFACLTVLDPGDEALIPSPYWTSYPEQVRLAGAKPVFVECPESDGFKLTAERLEAAVTPATKMLLLNYPSNPTGACYSPEELAPLAEICVRRGIWILADEIYSKLLFDGRRFSSIAQIDDEVRRRTVIIDGMSKTYSMTGWRIGYAAGPPEIIAGMSKLQSHSTSNATSISQWASIAALGMTAAQLAPRIEEFQRRRDETVERLRALPGVSCRMPEGAFYAFPDVSECLAANGMDGSEVLCRYLLENARVAAVPGEAFGSSRHIRISYAVALDRIREGMDRIAGAMKSLAER